MAAIMKDACSLKSLLPASEIHLRVKSGLRDDLQEFLNEGNYRKNPQVQFAMSTALHLADTTDSEIVSTLLSHGSNILDQNVQLELAGEKLSSAVLCSWVWRELQGRDTLLMLARKKVPSSVAVIILEYVVGLHLHDLLRKAVDVETTEVNAPVFAIALVQDDEEWAARCEDIYRMLAVCHVDVRRFERDDHFSEFSRSFCEGVRTKLEISKRQKTKFFLEKLITRIREK
jgi:hypothetical protein